MLTIDLAPNATTLHNLDAFLNFNLVYIINLFIFAKSLECLRSVSKQINNQVLHYIMEKNSNLTAEQSLKIINDSLNSSRLTIIRHSGDFFILWGTLLLLFSMLVFFLWKNTGSPVWNMLWFAMPLIGYPIAWFTQKKKEAIPDNFVSGLLRATWTIFGIFSLVISACAVFLVPMNITLVVILLFGCAEAISGTILKNYSIIIAGLFTGILGAVAAVKLAAGSEQLLLFAVAGVILALTGIFIKFIKK